MLRDALFFIARLCDDRPMTHRSLRLTAPLVALAAVITAAACSAGTPLGLDEPTAGAAGVGGVKPSGGSGGSGSSTNGGVGGQPSEGGAAGSGVIEVGGNGGAGPTVDPKTCAEAAQQKSYVGCDFWPTVTPTSVWDIFDFAVVVANAGETAATVTVTRDGETIAEDSVEPNELKTIYLPWVPELKGKQGDSCGSAASPTASVFAKGGAYHLETSSPVTVYQFNALEYAPKGGPEGKDWSKCPGNAKCPSSGSAIGCFSYTNDASLLLPSTAMTGNYRVATMKTMTLKDPFTGKVTAAGGGYFVVTATQPGTTSVNVQLAPSAGVLGGSEFGATNGGEILTFSLEQGDAMEIIGADVAKSDLSGSLVQADQAVQVIAGMPCVQLPFDTPACDHIEESIFPIETLGKKYIVTRPTGPNGQPAPHMVRIYGNVDGTTLSFPGGAPKGTPSTIDAGQVIELDGGKGDLIIRGEFEIEGDHEFSVAIFLLGGSLVDPAGNDFTYRSKGDPSLSFATAVEQYRTKYVFLAPNDYDKNFVDVVQPVDATVTLDGKEITQQPVGIPGDPAFGIIRLPLSGGQGGQHVLEATAPVGIQVMGYGAYTSYHYPGGSNLKAIAPPPPPVK